MLNDHLDLMDDIEDKVNTDIEKIMTSQPVKMPILLLLLNQ